MANMLYLLNQCCLYHAALVLNPRPQPHLDLLRWRWSLSIWMMKSKMQSGLTPPVLMSRNAGWASTTAIRLPHASTLPPPLSATVRGDTQEMAHSTATRRKGLPLNLLHLVPVCRFAFPFPFGHHPCSDIYDKIHILDHHFYPSHRCYNECREGQCSGSPRFECECSLGWTSDPATLVLSGVECDVDCGCNFHSTCITAPGICDECQGEAIISSKKTSCFYYCSNLFLWYSCLIIQIGRLGLIVSTVVPGASVQPWLGAVAVCLVSVMVMVTLCKDTVTIRQASATAHTTLRDLTVSPAYQVTMETPGKEMLTVMHLLLWKDIKSKFIINCLSPRIGTMERVTGNVRAVRCFSLLRRLLPCLSPLLLDGSVVPRAKEDFLIVCGSCQWLKTWHPVCPGSCAHL